MAEKYSWLDWYCGMEKFSFNTGNRLSMCFAEVFFLGITDYLILIFCVLYHALYLKWYHNFNGSQLNDQTKTSQVLIYLKCTCLLAIAFSWLWFRLNPEGLLSYPLRHVVSDLARFVSWMGVLCVTFLEWNRSRGHHWSMRVLFCASFVIYAYYCYVIFQVSNERGYHSLLTDAEFSQVLPIPYATTNTSFKRFVVFVDASYFGHAFTLAMHLVLALLSLAGAYPRFRHYFEANQKHSKLFNHKSEDANEPPLANAVSLLMKQIINRESWYWLLGAAIVSLANGFFIQQVMKSFGNVFQTIRQSDFNVIFHAVLLLILLFVALAAVIGLQAALWGVASEKVVNGDLGVRNRLFRHLLKQTAAFHHNIGTGGILSRFSQDAEMLKALINDYMPILFNFVSLGVFGFYSMFQISFTSSIYLLTLLPLMHVVTYFQTELFVILENESQGRIALIASKVQDTFSKYHTVLYYGKKNTTIHQYGENVFEIYVIQRFKMFLRSGFLVLTDFFGNSVTLLSYFIPLVIFHEVTLDQGYADFVTYSLYSQNIIRGLSELIKLLPEIAKVVGATAVVLDMMDQKVGPPENDESHDFDLVIDQGVIEFQDVIFKYPTTGGNKEKDDNILKGISFKIKSHSKVAIIGDSGAGKSTLFQLIGRFYDITGGKILIDGQDIARCSTASIRQNLAIVSQEHDLFSCSLLENILYGHEKGPDVGLDDEDELTLEKIKYLLEHLDEPSPIIDKVMHCVREANCSDYIATAQDLAKELGEGGSGLSGGQKQRLTVARALYKGPKILLLDEVTSALDPISEQVVQSAIDNLTASRTVLIIAHRLNTIKNADLIIVMEKGNIVSSGTHDDLMRTSPKYEAMVKAGDKYGTIGKINRNLKNEIPDDLKSLTEHVYSAIQFQPALRAKYEKQLEHFIPTISEKRNILIDASQHEREESFMKLGNSLDRYRNTVFSDSEMSDSSDFDPPEEGFELLAENIRKSLVINTSGDI